jgi:hypothetical protein
MDELRCIEAQIEEAISLEQKGGYERIHLQSVLREGLVHCQLLRRMLETGRHSPAPQRGREEDEAWRAERRTRHGAVKQGDPLS